MYFSYFYSLLLPSNSPIIQSHAKILFKLRTILVQINFLPLRKGDWAVSQPLVTTPERKEKAF